MINRIVCKGMLITDWVDHSKGDKIFKTARIVMSDKKDDKYTVFIKVASNGRTAELLEQYTHKGDILFIDGRLAMDTYETKDGRKQTSYYIVIDKVEWEYRNNKPANKTEEDMPF